MIRFEGVTKKYPDGTVAVDDLTLDAASGQITVFVGPSGCGKTTSLRMINRMIEPTTGKIWLDDQDTGKVSPSTLRRGIGYVIQHAGLFPHRTILDNVLTVPNLLGRDRRSSKARAMELLERVGLEARFATRYPAQLSGGQQQRVGVARALAADPPVMLMDEPFSAVDPVVREQLQQEFLRLQGELGKTIVFVTHDIDEAIKLGDQVAVLNVGGVLAQLASPAELLARPANPFVAGFVGRDRGYRALGFESREVPIREAVTVTLGAPLASAQGITDDGWVLVIDQAQVPQGWLNSTTVGTDGHITPELLNLGGTLAVAGGPLRATLDAALSSPSGRGVVVDEASHLLGTVTVADVIAVIEAERGDPGVITYFTNHAWGPQGVLALLWAHIYLAVLPVIIGLVLAIPIGWIAARFTWSYPPLISLAGLIYTIPSLVLFVAMPGILGTQILSVVNIIVALTAYAVALLVRVVADGLKSVPFETKQAATAMGYRPFGRFLVVELPLAIPVIAAGVRVATVSNVSLVAVATLVGTAQLGSLIDTGLHAGTDQYSPIGLAIVLSLILALVLDGLIQLATRLATPWQRAVTAR